MSGSANETGNAVLTGNACENSDVKASGNANASVIGNVTGNDFATFGFASGTENATLAVTANDFAYVSAIASEW